MISHLIKVCLWFLALRLGSASVVSVKKDVTESDGSDSVGQIKYHYESSASRPCSHVLVMGVGTSMGVDDYDNIAGRIARGTSIVVVISNHQVGRMVKTSATLYARVANRLWDQLDELIPVCGGDASIMLGGHSASGQAALEAVQRDLFEFQPAGFIGLDPYRIAQSNADSGKLPAYLPTLNWGLTDTTCFVQAEQAALGAYRLSSRDRGRVLYAIDNSDNAMSHCVFTDKGCGMAMFTVCATNERFHWVYDGVAESIHHFVDALDANDAFSKHLFELDADADATVFLHVNEDVDETNLTE
jgi:hypothetical protein